MYDQHPEEGAQTDVPAENTAIVKKLKEAYSEWFQDVSQTRTPNFGMPPIVIGSAQQKEVVLTPQDKRVDEAGGEGWYAAGHWPVNVLSEGPYSVKIRLNQPAKAPTEVIWALEVGGERFEEVMVVPRGLDVMTLGDLKLSGKGLGKLTVRVRGGPSSTKVYQVTLQGF